MGMMLKLEAPIATRCDVLRTTMSVISTICLVCISVTLLSAGVYTVRTVEHLQKTYHPERLGSIFDQASSALDTFHATTSMLQSSPEDTNMQILPHMFQDARATMEHAHASLSLSEGLLKVPELKLMMRKMPIVIQALHDALPKDDAFYHNLGLALSDLTWVDHLAKSLTELSSSVHMLDVEHLLSESQAWRNMSLTTVHKLKRILNDL